MTSDATHPDLFGRTEPRIFSTQPDAADEGRIFVYNAALTEWFEREEGTSGAVEFSPVATSEEELRSWLAEQGLEMDELDPDSEFALMVRDEFTNEIALYPEAPELSEQPSSPAPPDAA